MALIRIESAEPIGEYRLRLSLTDGSVIERDVGPLLRGPIFDAIRGDIREFRRVCAKEGALVWPNGADLCPDMVIWNGLPPDEATSFESNPKFHPER